MNAIACDTPECIALGAGTSYYAHLIAAAEAELAERDGREPRPVEPGDCPKFRVQTEESRAMVQRILNSPPMTAAEEGAVLAQVAAIRESAAGGSR